MLALFAKSRVLGVWDEIGADGVIIFREQRPPVGERLLALKITSMLGYSEISLNSYFLTLEFCHFSDEIALLDLNSKGKGRYCNTSICLLWLREAS